jgi:hypothetical protein
MNLEVFFSNPLNRKYIKYQGDHLFQSVVTLLDRRSEQLISSVENHSSPALQGVATELEQLLSNNVYDGDKFFISAIGSVVRDIMVEHGYRVNRHSCKIRRCKYVSTASSYEKCHV